MGRLQAEKPLVGEEGVGPTLMVRAASVSLQAEASTEDAAQPHPYPSVQSGKRPLAAVLKVPKPAPKDRIELCDGQEQTLAGGPFRRRSDRVLELVQAFRSWSAGAFLEPIAQEVEGFGLGVDQPRLGRMQGQAGFRRPLSHDFQGTGRVLRASAQDHEIIRVAHHLKAPIDHQVVERVEVDVAQQRADHAPNNVASHLVGGDVQKGTDSPGKRYAPPLRRFRLA